MGYQNSQGHTRYPGTALLFAVLGCLMPGISRADGPTPTTYTSIMIVQPHDQETVHDNTDSLRVDVAVEPSLHAGSGDSIKLVVDGTATAAQTTPRFQLTNMVRGSHTVQALIVDRNGSTLLASAPITVHMWHASRLFPHQPP